MASRRLLSDEVTRRAACGDTLALAEAFELLRSDLKEAVAIRIDPRVGGRIDPSDVVQETYLDAERRAHEFVSQADRMPLHIWFRLLAMQRLVDLHRQHLGAAMRNAALEIPFERGASMQTSSIWMAEQLIDDGESGSEAAIRAETQSMVHAALERMDPLDREVLAMRHFEMLTNGEVATILGISATAASNRYIRALRRLQVVLSPTSSSNPA
ncbi:MAG: sigma-70 family RNA polymerase sigma factor [Pirellulales bacterium]|nr:sigma-70 family RNA polymerase sigma factor [Pirellulales bacterium]